MARAARISASRPSSRLLARARAACASFTLGCSGDAPPCVPGRRADLSASNASRAWASSCCTSPAAASIRLQAVAWDCRSSRLVLWAMSRATASASACAAARASAAAACRRAAAAATRAECTAVAASASRDALCSTDRVRLVTLSVSRVMAAAERVVSCADPLGACGTARKLAALHACWAWPMTEVRVSVMMLEVVRRSPHAPVPVAGATWFRLVSMSFHTENSPAREDSTALLLRAHCTAAAESPLAPASGRAWDTASRLATTSACCCFSPSSAAVRSAHSSLYAASSSAT